MDNKNNNTALPDNDDWFDALLKTPEMGKELNADEQALSGLPELSDMELEKILQEALAEDWQETENEVPQEVPAEEDVPLDLYSDNQPPMVYHEEQISAVPAEEQNDEITENDSTPAEELPEQADISVRKVRPKRKKGYGLFGLPHLISTAIWFFIVIAIGSSFGKLVWVCAADILAFGRDDQAVTITITAYDNLDSVTDKLYEAGLIQYKQLFKLYGSLSNAEKKISAGTFELNTLYDYHALVSGMSAASSYRKWVKVTIPEGYNCAQIFALLEEEGVCSVADLEEFAANGELNPRWFLAGLERGHKYCLEGYLFPDTYEFYIDDTPSRVIGKMLDGFGNRLEEAKFLEMLGPLNERLSQMMASHGYDQNYISQNQMDLKKIITLASIVEKESAGSAESYTIASVFYNRLTYQVAFPYLNSDATVYYAIGEKRENGLTAEDLQIDSPYNTYKYAGLTPGPISNPSLSSIYSALDPDDSTYYYFIYDKTASKHRFSSTLEEHKEWIGILGAE